MDYCPVMSMERSITELNKLKPSFRNPSKRHCLVSELRCIHIDLSASVDIRRTECLPFSMAGRARTSKLHVSDAKPPTVSKVVAVQSERIFSKGAGSSFLVAWFKQQTYRKLTRQKRNVSEKNDWIISFHDYLS